VGSVLTMTGALGGGVVAVRMVSDDTELPEWESWW